MPYISFESSKLSKEQKKALINEFTEIASEIYTLSNMIEGLNDIKEMKYD